MGWGCGSELNSAPFFSSASSPTSIAKVFGFPTERRLSNRTGGRSASAAPQLSPLLSFSAKTQLWPRSAESPISSRSPLPPSPCSVCVVTRLASRRTLSQVEAPGSGVRGWTDLSKSEELSLPDLPDSLQEVSVAKTGGKCCVVLVGVPLP